MLSQPFTSHEQVALLYINVERTEQVSALFGEKALLYIISEVVQRIKNSLNPGDILGRSGHDELSLLITNIQSHDSLYNRVDLLLELFEAPITYSGESIQISLRIGSSLACRSERKFELLTSEADKALSEAKRQSSANTTGLHICQGHTRSDHSSHKASVENRIQTALARDEMTVFFQPQTSLLTGRIIGCEALARISESDGTLIQPMDFIPVAEQSGQIRDISRKMVTKSFEQIRTIEQLVNENFTLTLNVSPTHFDRSFIDHILTEKVRFGLKHCQIELDISEQSMLKNIEEMRSLIRQARALGIKIALDDFAGSFTSLALLKELSIDTIKLDKSFIDDITRNETTAKIAETVIGMAKSNGLKIVAEGVTTEAQSELLGQKLCDQCQGYYYSPPVSILDLIQLIELSRYH